MNKLLTGFLSLLLALCLCITCQADIVLSNESKVYSGATTILLTVPSTHTLTFRCGSHGSVLVDGVVYQGTSTVIVPRSSTVSVTIVPFEGYYFDTITASAAEGVSMDGSSITIANVTKDYAFELTFAKLDMVLDPEDAVLAPGMDLTIAAENVPEGAVLSWTIENNSVATVDENGTVHAVQTGETTVSASDGSETASGSVTVRDLNTMNFPSMLGEISEEAMLNNKSVENIVLSGSVTKIGARAFAGCTALRFIRIPSSVTSIGDGCFEGCTHVIILCAEGSAAQQYAQANGIRVQLIEE